MKKHLPGGRTRRYFDRLGDRIARRWIDHNLSEAAFPGIADEELKQSPAHLNVHVGDLLEWVSESSSLPPQLDIDAAFGRPPLTVYATQEFNIDVLFWTTSTTSIHQHGFSGVFSVIAGSSLHSRYTFEQTQALSEAVQFGTLTLRGAELLEAGDQHRIVSGDRFIHALFHLDHPSISLVIRTHASRVSGPQFTYLPPHLAVDPFLRSPNTARTLQFLGLLLHLHDRRVWRFVERVIAARDFLTAWNVLVDLDKAEWPRSMPDYDRRRRALLQHVAARHRVRTSQLAAVLDERRRVDHIVALRGQIKNSEHRLLLALALNLRSARMIKRFVRQREPHRDPVETIVGWLGAMGDKTGVNLDAHMLTMLGGMLRGKDMAGCLRLFTRRFGAREVERNRAKLIEMRDDLSRAPLFRALLSQDGPRGRQRLSRRPSRSRASRRS